MNRTCSINACERRAASRGWCDLHWQRWKRTGDPEKLLRHPAGICSVDGCERKGYGHQLCKKHLDRWYRLGTTELASRAETFWSRVDVRGEEECWEWQGARHPKGHGYAGWKGRLTYAHRVAWMLRTGEELEPRDTICHSCDNPPCCNPLHLFKGTQADNVQDMINKGRGWWQQ